MKNIYNKIHLLSLLIAGSCLLQSPLNALNKEEYNKKYPVPVTTTVPTSTPRIKTFEFRNPKSMSSMENPCGMSLSDIKNASRNLIDIMGLESMAEIAIIAYVRPPKTEAVKGSTEGATKVINAFEKHLHQLKWSPTMPTDDKVAEFSSRMYAVPEAFKSLSKNDKFLALLKKKTAEHFTNHMAFYMSLVTGFNKNSGEKLHEIQNEEALNNAIIALMETGGVDGSSILSQLTEFTILASSTQTSTDDEDLSYQRDFYQSIVMKIFKAFGKKGPEKTLFAKYKVPLLIFGATALTAAVIYYALGEKGKATIKKTIQEKSKILQNKATELANTAWARAGALGASVKTNAKNYYGKAGKHLTSASDWIKNLVRRKQTAGGYSQNQ